MSTRCRVFLGECYTWDGSCINIIVLVSYNKHFQLEVFGEHLVSGRRVYPPSNAQGFSRKKDSNAWVKYIMLAPRLCHVFTKLPNVRYMFLWECIVWWARLIQLSTEFSEGFSGKKVCLNRDNIDLQGINLLFQRDIEERGLFSRARVRKSVPK